MFYDYIKKEKTLNKERERVIKKNHRREKKTPGKREEEEEQGKLEIELPYDPAIPLLGIHTEETRRERDMCTPMFIALRKKRIA